MISVDIYRAAMLIEAIKPDPSSSQQKKIMGMNQITLVFSMNHYTNFQINDWCTVFGERYQVNKLPVVDKKSERHYDYTMVMEAEGMDLAKVLYLFLGDDNSLKEANFSLMGNADTFIDHLITNMLRVSPGWQKGQVIPTDYKNITFSNDNCFNALGEIAKAFDTEFAIEGRTIHLTKRSRDTGNTYKHGKGRGLYTIVRQEVQEAGLVTRLYAYGSEKNLPGDYRNFSKRLKMPLVDYVEMNVDLYGIIEAVKPFDDIYPRRTGKITSVNAADIYVFIDAGLDFDINAQLLPGTSAKITFNTGQLKGYTFDIASYNHASKEIRILQNKSEKSLEIPSQAIKPVIGDEYVLTDIKMPQTYVDEAELQLQAAAQTALVTASVPQVKYTLEFNQVFMRDKQRVLQIADLIWLEDAALEVQRKMRIVAVTRQIVEEYSVTAELSETVEAGRIDRIINTADTQGRNIQQIQGQISNNTLLNGVGIFPASPGGPGFKDLMVELGTNKIYRKE